MAKKNSKKTVPDLRFRGFTDPWEQRQLGEVAEKTGSGGTPVSSNPRYYGGSIPFLGIGDINGRYVDTTQKTLTEEGMANSAAWIVPEGAISLAMYASYGKSAILARPMATSQAFFNIVFRSNVTRDFVYSRLQCAESRHEWDVLVSTGTQPNLSGSKLKKWTIGYPSLPEQRRIGEFFSTLDSLIAAAERQEALLRQKKQAYLQLMFPQESETEPQLRFSGFNDAWKRIALRSVLKINEERNTASEFGFEKTISVSTMRFKPEGNGAAHASLETYRVLRVGDVAFEGNRHKEYPYGHVVINDIGDGLMSSRFRSFRPTQLICVPFWKYLLQNRYIMTPLLLRSTMRGTLMNELVVDDFLKQRTPMPSLQEQLEIGDFFETLDRLIENAEGRIAQLRKMKSSYLQKLFV